MLPGIQNSVPYVCQEHIKANPENTRSKSGIKPVHRIPLHQTALCTHTLTHSLTTRVNLTQPVHLSACFKRWEATHLNTGWPCETPHRQIPKLVLKPEALELWNRNTTHSATMLPNVDKMQRGCVKIYIGLSLLLKPFTEIFLFFTHKLRFAHSNISITQQLLIYI